MENFTELSINLTKKLSKDTKKENGIYFTPKALVKYITDFVFKVKPDITTVLEPSCGSGQFLHAFSNDQITITALENNKTIYDELTKTDFDINGEFIFNDFLKHEFTGTFDLVVGNPPYFVIAKKNVDQRFLPFFEGRPNIYILFIIKSFQLLNEHGILAFVLPTNFLNCVYYNELRKYLAQFTILDIYVSKERFLETYQETCVFIVQKTKSNKEHFLLHFGDILIFKPMEQITLINELTPGSTTLANLGCSMNIGTVVWNQCKDDLTDDPTKTLLIYSSDIKNNVLDTQKYKCKKNYINKKGSTDTVLLVNRGYGTGKYTLNYALINGCREYLVENHCIVITHPRQNQRIELFTKIIQSFENPKTQKFIDLVFSNNAINIHEFLHILPIFF
jgi:adenine-specific DNA-methyltransferase